MSAKRIAAGSGTGNRRILTRRTIAFLKDGGATAQTTGSVTTADYTVIGDEKYIRVKVTRDSDSTIAWSNPITIYLEGTSELVEGGVVGDTLVVQGSGDTSIGGNLDVAGACNRGGLFQGVAATAQIAIGSGAAVPIEFDAETLVDTDFYTHSTSSNPEQITILATGFYKISYGINFDQDDLDRSNMRGWVEDDSAEVDASYSHSYVRGINQGVKFSSCTASFLAEIGANSVIELHTQVVDFSAGADVDTIADQSWILIEKVN